MKLNKKNTSIIILVFIASYFLSQYIPGVGDIMTQFAFSLITSLISGIILMWIAPSKEKVVEKTMVIAEKEEDPHKKITYIKDILDNIEGYYLQDYDKDKKNLDRLFKIIDIAKDVEEKHKEEEIVLLVQTCIERAKQRICDIGKKYKQKFEDEAQAYIDMAEAEKNSEKAIDILTKAIRMCPTAQLFFERGVLYFNNKNFKGSIEDYSEAIRFKPDLAEAYYNRGFSKSKLGDYKGAIEDYNEVIRIKPDDADAYNNRGVLKKELGDHKGAIEDYNEAIRIKPDYAGAYSNRGISKKELGDHKGAIEDYTEAIRIKPDYAMAFNNRGNSKSKLGDYKGAIEDYNEAIRIKPDYADAYNNRGNSKSKLGDYKGAIEDYNEAIRIKPDYADAYNNRGVSKKELGDHKGAIEDYTEAIRIKPDYAMAFNNRGASKNLLGNYRHAIEDYNEAIRLNPNYAIAFFSRGLSKANLGDYKGAIQDLDEAIRLNPGLKNDVYKYRNECLKKIAKNNITPKNNTSTKADAPNSKSSLQKMASIFANYDVSAGKNKK